MAEPLPLLGKWLSSGDGSLKLAGPMTTWSGSDSMGNFEGSSFTWSDSNGVALMKTSFKVYSENPAVGFSAAFPFGLTTGSNGTSSKDSIVSAFPSWVIPSSSALGWLQWSGPFINRGVEGPLTGSFDSIGAKSFSPGISSGPIVFLDESAAASLILSAASEFAAVSAVVFGGALSLGPLGSVDSLPKGYSYDAVAWLGAGVNYAIMSWGSALLQKFGKPHGLSKSDFTNTHLIYNTDHGAYYYYNPTKEYLNYTGALEAVGDYAASVSIPYRGVLLDSWWYFKGAGGGVKNWTAMPTVFDGGNAGIRALVDKFDWKVTAHNRYWSSNTDYAKQNGGSFDFFVDPAGKGQMAVPLDSSFWIWLLNDAVTQWGLSTYEQDWLYNELEGTEALLTNVTLAGAWLRQMGEGAESAGVSMQLCMAYPRHTLASIQMPTATQIRASDDHVPGWEVQSQWKLGYSSLLAWAVGLAPFKDNYWSTALQPGSSCGNSSEVTPSLHHASSVFSAGPVTPGDGVGFSDVEQIMRGCTSSGLLLHPSRPATAIDRSIASTVFPHSAEAFSGEVYATYTQMGGFFWDHVLVAELSEPLSVTPQDFEAIRADAILRSPLLTVAASDTTIAYSLNATTFSNASFQFRFFSESSPLQLAPCDLRDFAVWHTAPVFQSGYALLGDLRKFVPTSEMRFSNIQVTETGASADITGSVGEFVPVTWFNVAVNSSITVNCILSDTGRATVAVPDNTCF